MENSRNYFVPIQAPVSSPRVLHNPVVFIGRCCVIAHSQYYVNKEEGRKGDGEREGGWEEG